MSLRVVAGVVEEARDRDEQRNSQCVADVVTVRRRGGGE